MALSICLYGDAVLRKTARPVEAIDGDVKTLVRMMLDTLRTSNEGIGLAAPQVGHSLRLFVIEFGSLDWLKKHKEPLECLYNGKWVPIQLLFPLVVINPKIIEKSPELDPHEEGCLSLPDLHAKVSRPKSITMQYQDIEGQTQTLKAEGMLAKCLQHEYDHLNGVLIIDYLPPAQRDRLVGKLYRIQKQERSLRKNKGS
jgi:peptide deformylase